MDPNIKAAACLRRTQKYPPLLPTSEHGLAQFSLQNYFNEEHSMLGGCFNI